MTTTVNSVVLDNNDLGLIEQALRKQMSDSLRTYASFSDSGIGIPGQARQIQALLGKLREPQASTSLG